jgi:ParB family transcriptional regulator, chromosome partitioning protein
MNKNSTARRALGRGLSNLIPVDSEERGSDNNVVFISADALRANPFQPRRDISDEEIEGLAQSIETQGLLQPLVVRKKVDGYEIISGERRFRALQKLKRDKVLCIVRPKVSDREMLELALVENLQRENLNDIETATAYQKLLLECSWSHEELAKRVGKSRSAVSNTLRLLKLPVNIQQLVRNSALSMGHVRALLSLDNEERQKELAQKAVDEQWSVRQMESAVLASAGNKGRLRAGSEKKVSAPHLEPDLAAALEKIQYRFGTSVKLSGNPAGKGKIEISFLGPDDLHRIFTLLA